MINARKAPVAPRVLSESGAIHMLLEDEVHDWLSGNHKVMAIIGGSRTGKTTALEHLQATLDDGSLDLLDEPDEFDVDTLKRRTIVTFSKRTQSTSHSECVVRTLAPWDRDDVIEWLMASQPTACANVMSRLRDSSTAHWPEGNPGIWATVLTRMAGDPSVVDVRATMRDWLFENLTEDDLHDAMRVLCRGGTAKPDPNEPSPDIRARLERWDPTRARILAPTPIASMLVAAAVARDIVAGAAPIYYYEQVPGSDLLSEIAIELRAVPGGTDAIISDPPTLEAIQPLLNSVMVRAVKGWRPKPSACSNLSSAKLDGAEWSAMQLAGTRATVAVFNGATLDRSDLSDAQLVYASFLGTSLRGTRLGGARISRARFQHVDLRDADLTDAQLDGATLFGARADQAEFTRARMNDATLRDSSLVGAVLRCARLDGAKLQRVDLRESTLDHAVFTNAIINDCRLDGASLRCARMIVAKLEGLNASDLDLRRASLRGAMLTSSSLPNVDLRRADLREAGLAEIEWEGADLRHADLRRVSFHLGSSRSGHVNSEIACEGSRTGFYTDDEGEQAFKAPEEIRKANLRGADLRGANLEGVDFYLVDLRDARYDATQRRQLVRTRAIL